MRIVPWKHSSNMTCKRGTLKVFAERSVWCSIPYSTTVSGPALLRGFDTEGQHIGLVPRRAPT